VGIAACGHENFYAVRSRECAICLGHFCIKIWIRHSDIAMAPTSVIEAKIHKDFDSNLHYFLSSCGCTEV